MFCVLQKEGIICQREIELGQTPHNTEMGVIKQTKAFNS